jgi:hypothetical protein
MEDILAIIAVLAGVTLVTLAVRWFLRRSAEKAAMQAKERERQIEQTRIWRESMRAKSLASAVKNTSSVPPRGKETTKKYTPTYSTSNATSTTTTTTSNDDGFLTGMLTGMLIDSAIDSFKHGTDRDTGEVFNKVVERSTSQSSWGFDDDSRKSASSSFSSSDSSSSWSSSSSDSGPSSDW